MATKRLRKSRILETSKFDNNDEISQLPDVILGRILFYLPIQDAARVSTLSKTWLRVWNSLPVFHFSFDQHQLGMSMLEFVNRVNTSLSILQNQKAKIESFTLKTISLQEEDFASNIDNWVGLVMRNYVRELCIQVSTICCTLPQATFASMSLVKLTLEGCIFPATLMFADTAQEFNRLKELHLIKVVAEEDQIQNLVKCFRSLERLTIRLHNNMQYLVLDNCPMLQYVAVGVKILTVDAENLQTLILCRPYELHASDSTVNLRQLWCAISSRIPNNNQMLQELVSKFPFLDTLYLSLSNNERFRIQHHHLRTLHLYAKHGTFENPVEVELDTPKLHKFYCSGSVFPYLHVASTSIKEWTTFELHIRNVTFAILDGSCIHQLGNFLRNFDPKIEVNLHQLCTVNSLTLEQLQEQEVISLPLNFRKLVLRSISASSDYTSFLDGLLWTCHPRTLQIKECSVNGDNFIKFLCRELLGRQENPTCCGDDLQSKCWRHFLKGVKVDYYRMVCEPGKPIRVSSSNLSETLIMCDTGKQVNFSFEWSQEPVCSSFQDF